MSQDVTRELSTRAERLLLEREAQGLQVSMGARLALLCVGLVISAATSPDMASFAVTSCFLAISLVLAAKGFKLARRRERLLMIGRVNLGFDVVLIMLLPVFWYHHMGGDSISRAFMVKNDTALIVMVLLIINALSLRPLYPALLAFAALLYQAGTLVWAMGDPRFFFTSDNVEQVLGEGVRVGFVIWNLVATTLAGIFLTMLAEWARRTINSIVALEEANLRIMEAQAEAVLEAKMGALANLVAGVAHELNSPLGTIVSAAETSTRAARKVRDVVASDSEPSPVDARLEPLLSVLERNNRSIDEASNRMQEHLASLKSFTKLDQAEHESFDPVRSLEDTLALIPQRDRGEVVIERDYGAVPSVHGQVKALNHVFMTIVENAFQALAGKGTLRLRVDNGDDRVRIAISDDGPGMDDARVSGLFDLGFAARQGRIGIGLGLPNSRRIVEAHGGQIMCESQPGQGTTFRISLPSAA